jgi:hypothetical protein
MILGSPEMGAFSVAVAFLLLAWVVRSKPPPDPFENPGGE